MQRRRLFFSDFYYRARVFFEDGVLKNTVKHSLSGLYDMPLATLYHTSTHAHTQFDLRSVPLL